MSERGNYSLGEYSKEYMPVLMEHFRVNRQNRLKIEVPGMQTTLDWIVIVIGKSQMQEMCQSLIFEELI